MQHTLFEQSKYNFGFNNILSNNSDEMDYEYTACVPSYTLYKIIDKNRIKVGNFKDINDIIRHFNIYTYNVDSERIGWFEFDKMQSVSTEKFILMDTGYYSAFENKIYSYNLPTQNNNFIRLMTKIVSNRIISEIRSNIKSIEKKMNSSNNISTLKNLHGKIAQIEKNL